MKTYIRASGLFKTSQSTSISKDVMEAVANDQEVAVLDPSLVRQAQDWSELSNQIVGGEAKSNVRLGGSVSHWMVIDVESIGLHGQHYAVGWVVLDAQNGEEKESGYFACPPQHASGAEKDREWVRKNAPELPTTHRSPLEITNDFCGLWNRLRKQYEGISMAADCSYPVETNFLDRCSGNDFEDPYPLFEISSILFADGKDPTGTYPRLHNELPKHHPLHDARQSGRLLTESTTSRHRQNDHRQPPDDHVAAG